MTIPAGMVDWACILSSRLSTDDDATEFEYCSVLNSGSMSPAMEMESWSMKETLDRRLSPVMVTTGTEMETSRLFLT